MTHRNLERFLGRLDGVKNTGEGRWLAKCPAHQDRTPSLAVRVTDDDRMLVHCFAGCAFDDVVSAVGMEAADLMPEKSPGHKKPWEGVPGYRQGELMKAVILESNILRLALLQTLKGDSLGVTDLQRVNEAMLAISGMVSEVRRGK